MANRLKLAMINTILTLKERGWSQRRIARDLGIDRETVRRYLTLSTGSSPPEPGVPDGSGVSNPATNLHIGSPSNHCPGPQSDCEPYRKIIEDKCEKGLSRQRIWQDLRAEHEFSSGYHSVRRFINRLGQETPIPFRRMECKPGYEAQVDFGTGAPVIDEQGRRRKTHVLRIVLSFSRKAYSEVVYRQTTDNFIRCLENAFWYFGGVPETLVIDNLKAAVKNADWYDPDIHPKIQSFCAHYGTVILPCKPYMPRHKGKTEKGIEYVKGNGLKGRTFKSLFEENQFLLHWESHTADTRIHGTTRRQVGSWFQEQEKVHLSKLPAGRFPCFAEAQRAVHRDGHIEVQKAYYSVPPEYTGRQVWARWDGHLVRIFNSRMEQIVVHAHVEPGQFQTQQEHIHSRKRTKMENGTVWLLNRISMIGEHADQWAKAMLQARGIAGIRVLVGLLNLAGRHDNTDVDRACEIALSHHALRLKTLREILKRGGRTQQQIEFIDEHPIIRDLSSYGDFVKDCLT